MVKPEACPLLHSLSVLILLCFSVVGGAEQILIEVFCRRDRARKKLAEAPDMGEEHRLSTGPSGLRRWKDGVLVLVLLRDQALRKERCEEYSLASENTCFSSSSTVEELLSPDCCPLPGGGLAEATLALLMEMCLRIALQKHTPRKPATSTHDANLDAIAKNKDKKKRRKAKKVGGGDAPLQAEATLLPLLITEDSHDLAIASSVRLAAYPGRETDFGQRLEPHNRAPQPSAASKPRESVPQPSAASEQHNRAPPPSAASKPRESAPQSAAASEPHNRSTTSISSSKAPRECSTASSSFRAPTKSTTFTSSFKAPRKVPQPAAASEPHNRAPPPSAHQSPEKVCHVHQQLQSTTQSTTSISSIKPRESVPRPSAASEPHNRAPPPSAASKPRESVPRPSAASEHHNEHTPSRSITPREWFAHVLSALQGAPQTEQHLNQAASSPEKKSCHVHQRCKRSTTLNGFVAQGQCSIALNRQGSKLFPRNRP
eukprot:gene8507-4866_t